MPTPSPGESREDFVQRCIPIVIEDGTAEDGSQANAICNSMYEQRDKELDVEKVDDLIESLDDKKFTQQEANYTQPASISDVTCGTCRFFLRNEQSETGKCQVVEGDIAWFGTSDLYTSALDYARYVFSKVTVRLDEKGNPSEVIYNGT